MLVISTATKFGMMGVKQYNFMQMINKYAYNKKICCCGVFIFSQKYRRNMTTTLEQSITPISESSGIDLYFDIDTVKQKYTYIRIITNYIDSVYK